MPLRSRLLGVALGLTLVALVLTTAAVSALLRGYLFTQAEQELDIYLTAITKTEVAEGPGLPTGFTAKLLSADGSTVQTLGEAATESDRAAIPFLLPTDPRVTSGRTFVIDSVGDADRKWLAVAQATTNGTGTYVLALPLRPLDATVDQFRWYAAGIGAFALLVCAAGGVAAHRADLPSPHPDRGHRRRHRRRRPDPPRRRARHRRRGGVAVALAQRDARPHRAQLRGA